MENNFYSIDRLIEFGMGIAVAQQMVRTMNEAMQNMVVPGAMNPMQVSTPQTYYVAIDGKQSGPYSESEMMRLIASKQINKDTLVWMPGMSNWQAIQDVPQVLRLVALTPPPPPQPSTL